MPSHQQSTISPSEAKALLQELTREQASKMRLRAASAYAELDLTEEELTNAQKYFTADRQVSPDEFWSSTAVLRSGLLSKAIISIVEEVEAEVTERLVDLFSRIGEVDETAESVFFVEDELSVSEVSLSELITASIEEIFEPILRYKRLDEIGEQWHGELLKAATGKALESVETEPRVRFNAAVSLAETALLTEAPWAYTDRLLSAFETAHGKIRDHTRRSKRALTKVFSNLAG